MLIAISLTSLGQDLWDLRRCVDFAMANNISIQQNQVQERLNKLVYQQSKDGRWPSANFQTSGGEQFGRSVDPTTNQFTTNAISFLSAGFQTGVTLFNFFSTRNTIEANRLTVEASQMQTDKLRNDISLNVAAAYLQALLAFEQARVAVVQVSQTENQLQFTRKRVDAGAIPELNAVELEAQLARDSASLVLAESQYQLNLLSLKALLNLDASLPFAIATPPVEMIPVEPLSDLEPNFVYNLAVRTQPLQKANDLRYQSAQKATAAARGQMYPSLSASGNLNSNYSSAQKQFFTGVPTIEFQPSALYVPVNGIDYPVFSPSAKYPGVQNANVFRQFERNFRQSVGLTVSVPLFNGHQARTNWQRAKLNESNLRLQMTADSQQLKQNIFQAYLNATSALQTFQSRQKSVETSRRAFDLGQKRYDIGLLPTMDLIILQGNWQRSQIDALSARFDYIFRLKILEFYKGNGIKL